MSQSLTKKKGQWRQCCGRDARAPSARPNSSDIQASGAKAEEVAVGMQAQSDCAPGWESASRRLGARSEARPSAP